MSIKDQAIEAVHAIAKVLGVPMPNADVQHCAVCLILSLWNYIHEEDENGLNAGTYGWVVATIIHMLEPDAKSICATSLVEASDAVQAIRLRYFEHLKMERLAMFEEIRARSKARAKASTGTFNPVSQLAAGF